MFSKEEKTDKKLERTSKAFLSSVLMSFLASKIFAEN